ncbi:hypothetical protein [Streptomyces tubercidicus]
MGIGALLGLLVAILLVGYSLVRRGRVAVAVVPVPVPVPMEGS